MTNLIDIEHKLSPGREYREQHAYVLYLRSRALETLFCDPKMHEFYYVQLVALGMSLLEDLGYDLDLF